MLLNPAENFSAVPRINSGKFMRSLSDRGIFIVGYLGWIVSMETGRNKISISRLTGQMWPVRQESVNANSAALFSPNATIFREKAANGL